MKLLIQNVNKASASINFIIITTGYQNVLSYTKCWLIHEDLLKYYNLWQN